MSFSLKLNKYKHSLIFSLLITAISALCYFIKELLTNEDFFITNSIIEYLPFLFLSFLIFFFFIQWNTERLVKKGIIKLINEISIDSNQNNMISDANLNLATKDLIEFIRNRTTEINVLKDQDSYRKEFLGNVSHELKTPLFTIQGYILTLLDGALKDKSVRDKYLKRAAKGVDRLINIVLDLDLITQFESGIKIVDKEKFDIVELIQNVFDLIEIESDKNNIKLLYDKDYSNPIYVFADEERILQVITNLLINSLKYGVDGGRTEVSIEMSNNDKILIKVSDDGIGVSSDHLPRLFERFYRVDATRSRKKGGSGLGLSIVKHIIEAHNENIYVDSELGKGTTFSFTLDKYKT
ncbi:MAG: two-component sensor histidine kinase [Euryarchaeota archaeon]|nr:two-component sensor histidine kinase [Euryarchaeota archaeon]